MTMSEFMEGWESMKLTYNMPSKFTSMVDAFLSGYDSEFSLLAQRVEGLSHKIKSVSIFSALSYMLSMDIISEKYEGGLWLFFDSVNEEYVAVLDVYYEESLMGDLKWRSSSPEESFLMGKFLVSMLS